MLKRILGILWRGAPKRARRWGVWLAEPRFTVTAGAVVLDERGRILLLNHVFRKGSGWGIPGGFIEKREQPEEALRRELHEEAGLEVSDMKVAFARTLKRPQQVEIIYLCRTREAATVSPQSLEIRKAAWFERDALPPELARDQRLIIERALNNRAKLLD